MKCFQVNGPVWNPRDASIIYSLFFDKETNTPLLKVTKLGLQY